MDISSIKISLGALAILVLLTIHAPVTYAQIIHSKHPQEDYQSGYGHGVADAQPCGSHCYAYVWQSPNGFINQTKEWIDGYVTGFCSISGPDTEMDEPEADFDCNKGPSSAGWMVGHTIDGEFTSKFRERNISHSGMK